MKRVKLIEYMANITPCLASIETCGGAHHWARVEEYGHTVKIMSPSICKTLCKID